MPAVPGAANSTAPRASPVRNRVDAKCRLRSLFSSFFFPFFFSHAQNLTRCFYAARRPCLHRLTQGLPRAWRIAEATFETNGLELAAPRPASAQLRRASPPALQHRPPTPP